MDPTTDAHSSVQAKPAKPKMTFKRQMRRLGILLLGAYIVGFIMAMFFINRVLYWPPSPTYKDGEKILKLTTADGVRISAQYLENPKAHYTILYSHGNGEDMGDVDPCYRMFQTSGFSVLAYDYHGYGTSEGSPSEEATYADIDAAYDYLVNVAHVPPDRIILLGRSVGGGPATDLAARKPVGGLVLESAFTSAYRVATHWPIFPRDRYCNLEKLPSVKCPVLVVHGREDFIVRFWHAEKNFQAISAPKRSLWVDDAGHNDLMLMAGAKYIEVLHEFEALVEQQATRGSNQV